MARSRPESDVGDASAERLLFPVVDDELFIEVEPVPVVAFDANPGDAGGRRRECAGPSGRVPVEWNAAAGRVESPAKVHARVGARQSRRPLERRVVEVFAGETARLLPCGNRRKRRGWNRLELADRSARAWRKADRRRRPERTTNALENRDAPVAGTAVPAKACFGRIGADHGDRLHGSGDRQQVRVVLEQDDRCPGGLTRQRAMVGVTIDHCGRLDIDVRLLEQAELELHAEHPRDRRVDRRDRDEAALERVEVRPLLAVRRLKDDVQPGFEGVRGRRARVGLGHVQNRRAAGGRGVRDHEPLEPPVALQDVRQEPPILCCRRSVDGVVGGHDRACAGLQGRHERWEVPFGQRTFTVIDRIAVAAALADVGHEMFRRRDDARPLEGGDVGAAHRGGKHGILSIRFLDASPSHVVRDVDDRRQHLANASASGLAGDGIRDARDDRFVPGRRERDGRREHRRAFAGQAVDGFLERNDRDAEACLLDEVPLDRVDSLSVGTRERSRRCGA